MEFPYNNWPIWSEQSLICAYHLYTKSKTLSDAGIQQPGHKLIGLFGYVPARYLSGGIGSPIGTENFYDIVSTSLCSLATLV